MIGSIMFIGILIPFGDYITQGWTRASRD